MKQIFDNVSQACSETVTRSYSTSFSTATRMLAPSIRQHIHNIYGFVRFADEIVDTFHAYDKETLFNRFEQDLENALNDKISLNPILNSFQYTFHKFKIEKHLVDAFMHSMRLDLSKSKYLTQEEYNNYIYGSADVVGLMCLTVFVKGDRQKYEELKESAMSLGSAFQKVNFLRDLKADFEELSRTYFPNTDLNELDEVSKQKIIEEIEADFAKGLSGICKLPVEAKFGVYTAYRYYRKLLSKLKSTPSLEIKNARIRVPNYVKASLLARSYVKYRLNLI
ncbi:MULTISPECIES: phytoene/squalene synthase family protein [Leeuwenhoekiella]|uniref:Phytoene synthetase n=3 Tax=Leeuwenhoekiella TaxID=283735 RepID=A3XLS0_LEEBM|nr:MULTISPECIES: phytoene/squalene synthase family protein [Leeuwenhoekiella]EAQ49506.1 phytoene synthetase [Leeuwenhoekiella blandensis MED217]MAO44383.1 phytoene/squalene synthase family protein [Leeuwenhoekiella sp.]MBQ52109.1 phytoene/squalene synthase family protein [Leeuwenhoekiella sp.]HBT09595.1 phytoene/squalene synthase family protein [Leeuwenhoekiella sp.]|tara:strand:+ start:8662 stop:9501 length:840 start_codon:yes stop_codon:yes gene_type:complete